MVLVLGGMVTVDWVGQMCVGVDGKCWVCARVMCVLCV